MPFPQKKQVSYRPVKNIDTDAFKSDICSRPLVTESSNGTVGLMQQYNTTLCEFMDKHAPLVTKGVTGSYRSTSIQKQLDLKSSV